MHRLLPALILALPSLAFAQGQLTPPSDAFSGSAPTATMKSLAQVEPRIPLIPGAPGVSANPSDGGLIIGAAGSYYLTGNITMTGGAAIQVFAGNVTIDLNGFGLSSTSGATFGVEITSVVSPDSLVTIRNGQIGGFAYGIRSTNNAAVVVEDVFVNGGYATGLDLSSRSVVRRCTVVGAFNGINAGDVIDSRADRCSEQGIYAMGLAQNCTAEATKACGLRAQTALNCSGTSTAGVGLQATQTATGCYGTTQTGPTGLMAGDDAAAGTAENCRGIVTGGTGTGLSAETAANCFGQSTAGTGLSAATATNCSAYTASGSIAMSVAGTANSCRGNNGKAGGIAIQAAIAVSCTSAGGTISAPNKYNMP